MRLYLLRHAEAAPPIQNDQERALTPKGIEQARRVGAYCARHGLRPELILTSPFHRTVETGELVAAVLRDVPTSAAPFLASSMLPATALEELVAFQELSSVMLVGHQPDLGLLAAELLGLRESASLPFHVASLAGLQVRELQAFGASLEFFVSLPQM